MDLFDTFPNPTRKAFAPILGDWVDVLGIDTLDRLKTTLKFVAKDAENHQVFPEKKDVFRIFKNCSIKDIKVVIVGQDPYYNGNATGYAFGCKYTASPSLKQILKSMTMTETNSNAPKDIGLEYLVAQGVFLMNTVLTVRAGTPLSHNNVGWQNFTKDVVTKIQEKDNIVWLLWGGNAKQFKKHIVNPTNVVIEDNHPASAHHYDDDWNSLSFRTCNEELTKKQLKPIIWL